MSNNYEINNKRVTTMDSGKVSIRNTFGQTSFLLKTFLVFILLFALIEPDGIVEMSNYKGGWWSYVHMALKVMRYVSFLAVILMLFKIGIPSKMLVSIFIFNFVILFSSLYNGNLNEGYFITLLKITALSIMTEYMISKKTFFFIQAFFLFLLLKYVHPFVALY